MIEKYDVCVVGGGAAGMTAAIAAAENGCSVCIIDKNKKIGKKLYATGNGRCNLANADIVHAHFHSASTEADKFLEKCLGDDPNQQLFSFLHTIGIYEHCVDGYYYPMSMQASAVVWAFSDKLRTLPVEIRLGQTVTRIQKQASGYRIFLDKDTITASKVILACGGRSYASLGGCDLGYRIADTLGIKQEQQRPALCAVLTEEDTEEIKGVRIACSVEFEKKQIKYRQQGELQITDYGLSGIMMFNLSSEIGDTLAKGESALVYLDFLSTVGESDFLTGIKLDRSVYGYLNAFIPDKLALYILKACGQDPKQKLLEIPKLRIQEIYRRCRRFPFHIQALKDFEQAQVTAGGICLEEVNPETMECRNYAGLYATGEMLDIDGDCGGYNLTFAILTGLRAGRACHVKN